MVCDNNYCIYEENGRCTLDSISIDFGTNCADCIYVNIPEKLLNELKTKHRAELEKRYESFQM